MSTTTGTTFAGATIPMTPKEFRAFDERWRAATEEERREIIAELCGTTTADDTPRPWDGERDAFDPVRAGFVDERGFGNVFDGPSKYGGTMTLVLSESLEVWHFMRYERERLVESGYMPTMIREGRPMPHDAALAFLRANGYEGGDDGE